MEYFKNLEDKNNIRKNNESKKMLKRTKNLKNKNKGKRNNLFL